MTLRGPSAHLGARRGQDPGWRRSWEPSYWDGLMSEVEVVPRHTGLTGRNPPRQQSAREGGSHSQNLDRCLQELARVQCQTYFKGGSPVSSPGQVSKVELVSPPQPTPARTPRPHSAIEGRRQMNEWLYELEKMQSGDYFEGSPTDSPEVEPRPTVHLGRTPRPQSAIEGGSQNLDRLLQELERMENGRYFGNPDRVQRDQVQAPFYDRTASMPSLHKEPVGSGLRHHYQGLPSSPSLCSRDRDLSPCETPSLCDSSLGSQESLRAGLSSAPDHNGSWERAIIKQAPGKEEAKLSSLTPVRVGWLPIQRRSLLRDAPAPGPGHPHLQVNLASQVRLKAAITPTFRKNHVKGNGIKPVEGELEEVEWRQPTINTVGLRTRWLPDQTPPRTQHQAPPPSTQHQAPPPSTQHQYSPPGSFSQYSTPGSFSQYSTPGSFSQYSTPGSFSQYSPPGSSQDSTPGSSSQDSTPGSSSQDSTPGSSQDSTPGSSSQYSPPGSSSQYSTPGSSQDSTPGSSSQDSTPGSSSQYSTPGSSSQDSTPGSSSQDSTPGSSSQYSTPGSSSQYSTPGSFSQYSTPGSFSQYSPPGSFSQYSTPGSSSQYSTPGSFSQYSTPGSSSQYSPPGSSSQYSTPGSSQDSTPGSSSQYSPPGSSSQYSTPGSFSQYSTPGSFSQYSTPGSFSQYSTPGSFSQYSTPGSSSQYSTPGSFSQYSTPGSSQDSTPGSFSQYSTPGSSSQYSTPGSSSHTQHQAPSPSTQHQVTDQAPSPSTQHQVTDQAPSPSTQHQAPSPSTHHQAPSPSTQHQVSGKESSVPRERDNRSLGWQDQRRSWANRTPSHLSGSGIPTQSNNSLPGANTNSEPARKSPLHRTTSNNQQPSHTEVTPYGTSSQSPGIQPGNDSDSEPCWRASLHRTNSFQTSSPWTIRPTVQSNPSHTEVTPSGTKSAPYRSNSPLCRTNSIQQKPSHAELTPYRTGSEPYRATSLHKRTSSLPQPSPAGVVSPPAPGTTTGNTIVLKTTTPAFSSITIASKKISRTASLPGSRPLSPGSRAPRPQSYHSDEARVPGYKAPSPQSYHSDEARVPGYKAPRPQSYHCDEARVPGYKTPRPQSYHSDEARLSTTCTSVTQQDQVHHHHPIGNDPSSTPVTLRRKATATIVKVTEHRRMTCEPVNRLNGRQSPVSCVSGDQPNDQGTVVYRRKATIMKVTEHRESYSPGQEASGGNSSSSRPSEYRHSYTEGVYRHDSPWQQGAMNSPMNSMESLQSTTPSQYLLESSMDRIDRHNSALFLTPNKSTSTTTVARRNPERSRGGGKPGQKSTLMLFINSPSSKDTSIEKVGGERGGEESRDRARRPVSCYASVFGHTDPTEPCPVLDTVTITQAVPRRWNKGLPNQTQNTNIDPVRDWVKDTATCNSRFNIGSSSASISSGPAGRDREMCPPETESSRPGGRGTEREMCPPETESSRPGGRGTEREMCPPETESSRPGGRGTEREMCPPETESSRPGGRGTEREMCPPETESSRPGGRGTEREMCPPETESSRPGGRGTEREEALTQHPHQAGARSNQPHPPAITLIKHQEPRSHQQSPEAVLALNAAAVIANVKLQRQLSLRKTTPPDLCTQDSRSPTSAEGGKTLDHLFRPRDRGITGKEMQLRTRQNYNNLPEVRRKQEEEKRREDFLTNRLRADLFKKKLLEQILQRVSR
ncbi:uncharacterized protein LOC129842535 [Salvelinus fontinalis]|uniref:uncharacterized protein LOC129842535 n=1 Tax=Salvelinus fontinalis TaxID=8038 RepID=UPI0024854192|nr:uncharacterized protein LOC129842535 [Salvelinus fontinalis]